MYRYYSGCFNEEFEKNDKNVENQLQQINIELFKKLNTAENASTIFIALLEKFGEFQESTHCDQCGNCDTEIILNI